jgi:murein DD-endopeptidase MepM/ murein hydrolase activator NlpD
VAVQPTGWGNPVTGRLTSPFGMRVHPVLGMHAMHAGQDVAASCGQSVHAAAAGTVVWVGGAFQGRTGNQVVIRHGDGVVTRYGHLLSESLLVDVGDAVTGGQAIAAVGGDRELDPSGAGNSTGCHLHFEVNLGNGLIPVDPLAFLALRGVALGVDTPATGSPAATSAPAAGAAAVVADLSFGGAGALRERLLAGVGEWVPLTAVRPIG